MATKKQPARPGKRAKESARGRSGAWKGPGVKVLDKPVTRATRSRTALPLALRHATEFDKDPDLDGPDWVVRFSKRHPQHFRQALAETCIDRGAMNKRKCPGHWLLVRLAFTACQQPCIKAFYKSVKHNKGFWADCNFTQRPPLLTFYERMREFEEPEMLDALDGFVARLVQLAVKASGGLVGEHIHVDSTQSQTNAQFVHVCPAGTCDREDTRVSKNKDKGRALRRAAIAPTDAVSEERHAACQQPADEIVIELPQVGEADDFKRDAQGFLVLKIGGCWWASRDKDAGSRAYRAKGSGRKVKFWTGYYNGKAIDHYTGGAIYLNDTSASVNEAKSFPDLLDGTVAMLGKAPKAAVADRGYALAECVQASTERGIAMVCDYRASNASHKESWDLETIDADYIPRCEHCGSETRLVRFNHQGRKPRVWLECTLGATEDCRRTCACSKDCTSRCCVDTGGTRRECDPYDPDHPCRHADQKIQSRYCEEDWLRLRPLWQTEEAYQALLKSHNTYERVHAHMRQRWCVAGDSFAIRLRRIGLGAQKVQSRCALALQWLMILDREGWLGSLRRNEGEQVEHQGWLAVRLLRERRLRKGRTLPYGEKAVALGIGPLRPVEQEPDPPPGETEPEQPTS